MEATGSPIVSDGEQRWSSFATYPLTDTLAGTGLAPNLGGGGQYFAIFADGHHRQLPRLTAWSVPLQDLRGRHPGEVDRVRDEADEAGGHRALDARSPLSARRGGSRVLARGVRGGSRRTSARRTSARPSGPERRGSPSTSRRGASPPGPTRATRGPVRACSRTSSSSNNRVIDRFARRGARQDRCSHVPGRRSRLGA